MLDTALPVDIESRGRARDFMRRANAEFRAVQSLWESALDPLITRLERYPLRRPRQEHLDAAIRRWQDLPAKFRLGFLSNDERRSGAIVDLRLASTEFRDVTWAEDAPSEPALLLDGCMLVIPARLKLHNLPCVHTLTLGTVGFHALARRFQRCPQNVSDAAVMADLSALTEDILNLDVARRRTVGRVRVVCPNGQWRGELQTVRCAAGQVHMMRATQDDAPETRAVLCVRTFLSADELRMSEEKPA
jgi:hypothetical protein